MAYTLNSTGEVLTLKDVRTMFPNEDTTEITPELELKLGLSKTSIIPQCVQKRQAKLALFDAGLLTTIESMLAQDERARIEWDATHEVCIDYPLVVAMKSQLGLTDEQIRELFATASEL